MAFIEKSGMLVSISKFVENFWLFMHAHISTAHTDISAQTRTHMHIDIQLGN